MNIGKKDITWVTFNLEDPEHVVYSVGAPDGIPVRLPEGIVKVEVNAELLNNVKSGRVEGS